MSDPVPKLRRILTMIPLIRRSPGISIDDLAKVLKAKRKEIKQDLDQLMLCGVPPYLPHDYISVILDGDKITIEFADQFEKPARLTLREALALKLAVESIPPVGGEIDEAARELGESIDRLLRREAGGEGHAADLEGKIAATTEPELRERMAKLEDARRRRRPLDIAYFSVSSGRSGTRRVHPLGVFDDKGNHYLIAFDETSKEIRSFRVDRVSEIGEARDAPPFAPPEGFDLQQFTKQGIGPRKGLSLRIRFDAAVARFAREDYEGTARIDELPGGDVVVELTAGSIPWAVSRALAYGELAELLEPHEARAELVKRLEGYLASRRK